MISVEKHFDHRSKYQKERNSDNRNPRSSVGNRHNLEPAKVNAAIQRFKKTFCNYCLSRAEVEKNRVAGFQAQQTTKHWLTLD